MIERARDEAKDETKRGATRWTAVAVAVGALAASGWGCSAGPVEAAPLGATERIEAAAVAHVRNGIEVAPVVVGDAAVTLRAPGRLVLQETAVSTAAAQVSGRVAGLKVNVGDTVEAGDVVAVLHSAEAATVRGDLARARTALRAAEDLARRQDELHKSGVGLDVERTSARLRLAEARADLARARQAVEALQGGDGLEVTVRASASGRVLARTAEIGSVVQAGDPLVRIGDASRLWAEIWVYDRDVASVAVGTAASLRVGSMTGKVTGRVARVGASVDTELRRAPVYVELSNDAAPLPLRPGMFVRAELTTGQVAGVVLPTTAVVVEDGRTSVVFVEQEDGSFARREVVVGDASEGRIPVLQGVTAGERVVMRGALLLDPNVEQVL